MNHKKAYREDTFRITIISLRLDRICECGEVTRWGEFDHKLRKATPLCKECLKERMK